MTLNRSIPFAISLALLATTARAADKKPIELAKTPAVVQATIKKTLAANKMESLTSETDAAGKLEYVVEWYDAQDDGHFATIAADGKIVQTEDDIKMSDVPPACLAAIKAKRPGGTLGGPTRITVVGTGVLYEVDVTIAGVGHDVTADAAGKIFSDEVDGDDDDAKPAATTKP